MSLLLMGMVILNGVACEKDEEATGTGTIKLNLSDAPIDDELVYGVYITITGIQYDLKGEWKTFEGFEGPKKYNLLELTGGNFALLGEMELPAGHYTQIRFMLDIPEQGSTPANPGCYILFGGDNGGLIPLFVPSGGQTGYKATGDFTVPVNGKVEVTADFDIRKAVVEAGKSGKYLLKPTIRLTVNNQAGNIGGSITNSTSYSDIVVFAYKNGTWADAEANDPSGDAPRFPSAVTSGKPDKSGNYTLALLASGIYDLVVAGFNGEVFGQVLGFVPDIAVQSEKTTTHDIVLPFPDPVSPT